MRRTIQTWSSLKTITYYVDIWCNATRWRTTRIVRANSTYVTVASRSTTSRILSRSTCTGLSWWQKARQLTSMLTRWSYVSSGSTHSRSMSSCWTWRMSSGSTSCWDVATSPRCICVHASLTSRLMKLCMRSRPCISLPWLRANAIL